MPMMPPFGPPKRGGFFKGFLCAIVVFGLFCGAWVILPILGVAALALHGGAATRNIVEQTLVKGDAKEKIAVIPISGVIMDATSEQFNRLLDSAEADAAVKAIVLRVDSPGGSVTASDQIYHRIRQFKTSHPQIPVIVSMGDLAASGGYYLSCGADYIFAQETTLTADIGVLMPNCNFAKLGDKWGIEDETVCAPQGGYKNAGWPLKPVSGRDLDYLQGLVNDMFERFKGVVRAGRSTKLTKSIDLIADGRACLAPEARKLGLIDQIGYLDDALAYATNNAGLSSSRSVVRLHEPSPGLLQLLVGGAGNEQNRWSDSSGHASTTVNGINVDFDGATLNGSNTPRMLYLWQGQ